MFTLLGGAAGAGVPVRGGAGAREGAGALHPAAAHRSHLARAPRCQAAEQGTGQERAWNLVVSGFAARRVVLGS